MFEHKLHPATRVSLYKRQVMVTAGMLSVGALMALSSNARLTPATAAPIGQVPA